VKPNGFILVSTLSICAGLTSPIQINQSLTDNTRKTVWSGSALIDQQVAIRLDNPVGLSPLISKAFLTFYQPNYSLKQ
jgi:hypothetical protein